MSTVNCPWKSVSPNICAWGKGFNHFSAVVRCEVVFVVVIIWFSGLECSPYAFVPLSTTYHPHSLWKGIASTRTPGQRPSILSHKPDGDMSIQKAPPLSLQYTFTGHVFNSATRVQSVFTATHLCAYHPGATFQTICILIEVRISLESILNMFSTHLNWQLTWRWKSFLAQQYAASIAVIVSGAENVEWALDEACRAYPMMVDIPYMIQVPGTPPRSPCVLHVSFTPYTSIAYFAQDDWLWHAPVILSPSTSGGACEMGRWGAFTQCPYLGLIQAQPRFCPAKPSHCGHVPLATGGTLRCGEQCLSINPPPQNLEGQSTFKACWISGSSSRDENDDTILQWQLKRVTWTWGKQS